MNSRDLSFLKRSGIRVGLAESCTGGLASYLIARIPGASAVLEASWVTYSEASKRRLLRVSARTLARFGPVSEQVASEMASGVLKNSASITLGISITGIAGPSGALPGKPVGTVCFAWAVRGQPVLTEQRRFRGERQKIQKAAAQHAWKKALQLL